jgi:hypothetical protein
MHSLEGFDPPGLSKEHPVEMTRLCLYDIAIAHPRDWNVYINPQKLMDYTHGALKLEKLEKRPTDISTSIKWMPLTGFDPDKYIESLRGALKKKFKHKLHGFDHRGVEHCGHEAFLTLYHYADNHSIYKVLRKDEEVVEMQLMLPCETSGRIVIANVASIAADMETQAALFESLLMRLECHPQERLHGKDLVGVERAA